MTLSFGSLDQFVALAPGAMAMFDREMRTIAASPKWLAFAGLERLPVGRSHDEESPPLSEAWKAARQRSLAGSVESSAGEPIRRADGGVSWVRWESRPWLDENGAIGGIVITGEDITAAVEAQEKAAAEARRAEAAERRLHEAIDALPGGFSLYDPNDRLVVANEATRAMYPESADQMRPGALFEHLLRLSFDRGDYGYEVDDRERWLDERMERHRNPRGAIEQLTHSGRWLRIEERKTPDGGTVVIRTDVTELETGKEELARRNALLEDAARRAEAAERRLTEAIEVIPGGFLLYDAEDRLVVCNEAARAMYPLLTHVLRPGAHFEDIVSAGYVRLYDSASVDRESWLRERRERRRNPSGALEQKTDDGRWLRIEERRLSDGGLVALRTDITDLKTRERELAEKNALLEATLHSMGEGIAVFGPDLELLTCNEMTARILQIPAAALAPGASFPDLMRLRIERGDYGDGDADSEIDYRMGRFRAQRPWSETRRRPDGRVFETRFDPMPDGGGVFIYRDVTEQAEYEAKLIEKNALLEATLHNMAEGIAAFDADLKLTMLNDFAVRMIDLPPGLARPGAAYEDVLRFLARTDPSGEIDVESFIGARIAQFRAQKPFLVTRRLKDGRVIETRFNPTPGGGGVFIYRDVTERAEFIARLTDALAKAEQASRAKSEFLATASHELRTPMNAIIGLSGLLRESDLPETERRYAELIESAGESLLVVIDDLLEFASLEGRTPALEAASFDPRGLAGQAISIACPPKRTARLSILTDIDPAVPGALVGDGGRIRRILVNLLDNAVKHTVEGAVTVRARARPSDGAETTMLRIEVEDTGEGFPQSEAARLFEPFERGAMTDRTRAAGLGLGLAICRRLVDLMGGTIGAESAPGAGSRFWFEVPVRAEAPLPPPRETPAVQPVDERRELKVLVVEDVEANRDLTRAMLERLGHEAHLAEDGAEAIEAVRKADYDVILMDIQMPNVDGLEATRAIRAMGGRPKDVPIIAVSAFSQQTDRDAAFAAGVSGFLSKPLRRSELDDALRSLRFASGIWAVGGGAPDEGAP